eukprot:1142091-Pelagomonas_calceolata.AAC.2
MKNLITTLARAASAPAYTVHADVTCCLVTCTMRNYIRNIGAIPSHARMPAKLPRSSAPNTLALLSTRTP